MRPTSAEPFALKLLFRVALALVVIAMANIICVPARAALRKEKAQVTIDATVGGVALPATLIKSEGIQMLQCFGRLESAQVRYWDNGDAPTTTSGIIVNDGDTVTIDDYDAMSRWRGIRTGAVSATLSIECWR